MRSGLIPGMTAQLTWRVSPETTIHLAADRRDGAVVFATPSMINLMEHAARQLLAPFLEDHEESVESPSTSSIWQRLPSGPA